MESISYEKITVENIERLTELSHMIEIIFNADRKIVLLRINKEIVFSIIEICKKLFDIIKEVVLKINEIITCISNKKLSKKKFKKLLQSYQIQRNEINKIIENNRESYTYGRYFKILYTYKKDES